ncbi:MAG: glycosyltransferase [Chloroflexi bacterium]|nr:glycosyltransferase [Chloroflexota bacterium]
MRALLVLAHAFPPTGGAGVQRIAKFVKYLPAQGWWPTVVSAPLGLYADRDADLAADVPAGVQVVRTPSLELPAGAVDALRLAGAGDDGPGAEGRRLGGRAAGAVLRRAAYAAYRALAIPDRHVGWVPFAVAAGLGLARRQRFDAILATGNPFSAFVAARLLAAALRRPLVLDYRDAWTLNPYRQDRHTARWRAEARLERWVLGGAAGVLCATEPMCEDLAAAYPAWAARFVALQNGYDPADLAGIAPQPLRPFSVVYAGKFTPYRRPDTVLRATAALRAARPDQAADLRLVFVGDLDAAARALADALRLSPGVEWLGYRAHREALGYVLGAQALLLVGGGHRSEQTTKVFEYLAAGKPVLAVVPPDGAAADVLRASPGGGYLAWPPTPAHVAVQLVRLLEQWRAGRLPAASAAADEYARPRLTARLAELLDRWVDARS